MARETHAARAARVSGIISGLRATYPEAHCELNFENPLQLLIATMLSAQCSDRQVNLVTESLFRRFRTPQDYATAPLEELEDAIRRIGLYRNKARNIQATCRCLIERHDGEVPRTMEALVELPGVGRKTANVVLGNAYDIHVGVVVDTHVARLSERLGLTREKDPVRIEQALMKLVPPDLWTPFSHWLIWHGRRRCFARNPDCPGCEIAALCPSRGRRHTNHSSHTIRMSHTLVVLDSGVGEPAWNMALDEALLVTAKERGTSLLRFYGWTVPAATFGYSQRFAELEKQTMLRPLIRRPTGGGLVPHDRDWTYSLSLPPGSGWYGVSARESYRRVHAWIIEAFRDLGLPMDLASDCVRQIPGQCFAGHEALDVLWNGRKVAGAAQRRNRLGLLIQGSVQPPPRADHEAWKMAMRHRAPGDFFSDSVSAELPSDALELARALVDSKYGTAAHNAGR